MNSAGVAADNAKIDGRVREYPSRHGSTAGPRAPGRRRVPVPGQPQAECTSRHCQCTTHDSQSESRQTRSPLGGTDSDSDQPAAELVDAAAASSYLGTHRIIMMISGSPVGPGVHWQLLPVESQC